MTTDIPSITTAQMKLVHVLAKEAGVSHAELSASAKKMFGVSSLKDLDISQAGTLIDDLLPEGSKMPMPEPKKVAPVYTKFPTRAAMLSPKKAAEYAAYLEEFPSEPVEDTSDEEPEAMMALTTTEAMATGAKSPVISPLEDPEATMPLHPEKEDEPFEPDSFDDHDDAPIITMPLQPLPKPPPLYVTPAKPGVIPVRPPHGGGLVASRVAPTAPRPSFLKGGTPRDKPPPPEWPQAPAGHHNPITIKYEDRAAFGEGLRTGLRMPVRTQAPKPPELPAPKPAAAVAENRQTGGFGRLRASVSTATLPEPAGPEHPSEFKRQTQKVPKVYSGLTADDIPF